MPTYASKTYESGFYNNNNENGVDDRKYSAEQLSESYIGIFTNGVKPNIEGKIGDDLQVLSTGGMTINVSAGRGIFGNKYFKNKSAFSIILDQATSVVRYDAIIVRSDKSELVRDTTIYVLSLDHVPTINDLERNDEVQEYMLAYIKVGATVDSITQSVITDTRIDSSVCGLVTSAYKELDGSAIAKQWETTFNEWFMDVKDNFVAGASLVRTYFNTYYSETENQTTIPIGISQYNKNLDVLIVMLEGRVVTEGINYTITDNNYIKLAIGLPVVSTKVQFQVLKSVDGSNAETVISEVTALRKEVDNINRVLEYHYLCNGETDNINISNIINNFQTKASDYSTIKLNISGAFGASTAFSGDGTSSNPYVWLRASQGTVSNRKVILDFTNCRQLNFNLEIDTYNVIFFGMDPHVIGANVIATGASHIYMFSTASNTVVKAEGCRFWVTATNGGYIARSGYFKNCRVSHTVTAGNAYAFEPQNASLLRLEGGEYYAYAGTGYSSAVVYIPSGQSTAVAVTYGINAPTIARGGYVQSYAINVLNNSATCSFTDTITALPVTATGQNIRGIIAVSKAGML